MQMPTTCLRKSAQDRGCPGPRRPDEALWGNLDDFVAVRLFDVLVEMSPRSRMTISSSAFTAQQFLPTSENPPNGMIF